MFLLCSRKPKMRTVCVNIDPLSPKMRTVGVNTDTDPLSPKTRTVGVNTDPPSTTTNQGRNNYEGCQQVLTARCLQQPLCWLKKLQRVYSLILFNVMFIKIMNLCEAHLRYPTDNFLTYAQKQPLNDIQVGFNPLKSHLLKTNVKILGFPRNHEPISKWALLLQMLNQLRFFVLFYLWISDFNKWRVALTDCSPGVVCCTRSISLDAIWERSNEQSDAMNSCFGCVYWVSCASLKPQKFPCKELSSWVGQVGSNLCDRLSCDQDCYQWSPKAQLSCKTDRCSGKKNG